MTINILEAFGMIHKTEVVQQNQMIQGMALAAHQASGIIDAFEPFMTTGYYMTIQGIMMYGVYRKDAKVIECPDEFVDRVTAIGRPIASTAIGKTLASYKTMLKI